MSDGVKKLSEEQKKKFLKWLNSKEVRKACPACGANTWMIGDHVVSGITIAHGGVHLGGPLYPTAFIACQNCWHVLHFMAVPIGLLEEDQPGDTDDG